MKVVQTLSGRDGLVRSHGAETNGALVFGGGRRIPQAQGADLRNIVNLTAKENIVRGLGPEESQYLVVYRASVV